MLINSSNEVVCIYWHIILFLWFTGWRWNAKVLANNNRKLLQSSEQQVWCSLTYVEFPHGSGKKEELQFNKSLILSYSTKEELKYLVTYNISIWYPSWFMRNCWLICSLFPLCLNTWPDKINVHSLRASFGTVVHQWKSTISMFLKTIFVKPSLKRVNTLNFFFTLFIF